MTHLSAIRFIKYHKDDDVLALNKRYLSHLIHNGNDCLVRRYFSNIGSSIRIYTGIAPVF